MLDPLRDPLKDNAVVPQKYVDTLKRQGYVKVVRCGECKYWDTDRPTWGNKPYHWCSILDYFSDADFYCADGERADAPTCGPDYCEIGGETNDNTFSK